MRFAIAELQDHDNEESYEEESNASASTCTASAPAKKQKLAHMPETEYPQSVSKGWTTSKAKREKTSYICN